MVYIELLTYTAISVQSPDINLQLALISNKPFNILSASPTLPDCLRNVIAWWGWFGGHKGVGCLTTLDKHKLGRKRWSLEASHMPVVGDCLPVFVLSCDRRDESNTFTSESD